jgi:acetyltransferase-like isoleucine patch superfamily enzyme
VVVVICKNVYVGAGAFILEGIVIGHNVAIGANTVETKSVPGML